MEQNQLPGYIYFQGDRDSDKGFTYDQYLCSFSKVYMYRVLKKKNEYFAGK
jgi:hypothetical protein